ncbi:MAG: NHL repeat-containing protein [Treponema sp.]|jgi:DNA-binding beta-propeller fold protein YncE|nr:NHL repeat-containing protein [Treponema sp.]
MGRLRFLLGVFVLSSGVLWSQQLSADLNGLYAEEQFRIGIQAYNRYAFNEAILSFERALSFRPGEPLILDWLGRSYYRSGMEEIALRQWRAAAQGYGWNSGEGMLLGSRIETLGNRRGLLPVNDDDVRYVEAGRYPGEYDGNVYYRQPTSVLPLEDGSVWVVAYGSNEILRLDVNGMVLERKRGPLVGFDRPYDLVRSPGGDRFYLSEYRGGRISVLSSSGDWLSYIGSRGLGDGNLLGPQNLTVDEDGYIYVVDYGNRRVVKFDPDGTFILSFGRAARNQTGFFPGFLSPTGIAEKDGLVYTADAAAKQIFIHDSNGMYRGTLAAAGLTGPESLRFLADGRLLAADTNRVLLIDPSSAQVRLLGTAGNSRLRITGADLDSNGNILAANFNGGEISVLTRLDDMASGLFVQVERINAENFPRITVDFLVQDRLRRPIVGLDARNFLVSEEGRVAAEQNLTAASFRSPLVDLSILVERSPRTLALRDDLEAAVRDISQVVSGGRGRVRSLVSAAVLPQEERIDLPQAARGRAADYDSRWRFDLGLRLAATDLLGGEKKRAVVFVSSGELSEQAFERYSLSELAAYLANNGIVFHTVLVGGGSAPEELRYLCRETGGEILPLYRPQGIGGTLEKLAKFPCGSYRISYRSQLSTNFGTAYLPVEIEVYLMERSGRDAAGYFAPLE